MSTRVSFVVPAYNEGEHISAFLAELKNTLRGMSQEYEVIVIDDGSTDDTGQKAADCGAAVVTHKENLGYGRSLKDGIRATRGEYTFLMDADGTYDVKKIPQMLEQAHSADLVVGKRIFSKKSAHRFKNLTRRFFAYQVGYYAKNKVEDLNSGQRVFKRKDVVDELDRYPDGFSFTSTQVVFYLLKKKKIIYTPITYHHRSKGSKFLSRKQVVSMAKLYFSLTFLGRPFLIAFQLGCVFAAAGFLAKIIGDISGGGLFPYVLSFLIALPVFFFVLLSYIYAMGSLQKARSY
jgi:glycosyltransferase involved in cell wall biosynthesis